MIAWVWIQTSQQRLPLRPDPQGPPEGHLSASEDSCSDDDSPDLEQSPGAMQEAVLAAQLADGTTAEDTDSPASKQPSVSISEIHDNRVPVYRVRELLRRRAGSVENKVCSAVAEPSTVQYVLVSLNGICCSVCNSTSSLVLLLPSSLLGKCLVLATQRSWCTLWLVHLTSRSSWSNQMEVCTGQCWQQFAMT